MSENLTANLPETLRSLQTKHLFTMRADVKPIVVIGAAPGGYRRAGIVLEEYLTATAFQALCSTAGMTGRHYGPMDRSSWMLG
jgi:hypothetical protein